MFVPGFTVHMGIATVDASITELWYISNYLIIESEYVVCESLITHTPPWNNAKQNNVSSDECILKFYNTWIPSSLFGILQDPPKNYSLW